MINTGHMICRRYAKRMSQRELAERVGCTQNYIHRIERGKQGLSLPMVAALCRVLDTEPNKLIAGWQE